MPSYLFPHLWRNPYSFPLFVPQRMYHRERERENLSLQFCNAFKLKIKATNKIDPTRTCTDNNVQQVGLTNHHECLMGGHGWGDQMTAIPFPFHSFEMNCSWLPLEEAMRCGNHEGRSCALVLSLRVDWRSQITKQRSKGRGASLICPHL